MKILKILETVKNFIKKNKKLVTVVSAMFCAVVLVAGSIAGTIAYLTDTKTVTNTFTVGNITITLDESPVNENGQATTGARVTTNTFKLIPGKEYDKDPVIHVAEGSEACWLFVKVENNLADIEASSNTIVSQLTANGWTALTGEEGVYYHAVVDASAAAQDVSTFTKFVVNGTVQSDELSAYADETIVVTAYAIQSNGFDTAAKAWEAGNKTKDDGGWN